MANLCSLPSLAYADWAAWVQALGTIAAIAGSVGIAVFQANKQQRMTMAALVEERRLQHLRTAATLHAIAVSSLKLQNYIASKLNAREAVHNAGRTGLPFDMPTLRALENSLDRIELHSLPETLVPISMTLIESVRQFRIKVEMALANERHMDADQFDDFFKTLDQMNKSLRATVEDFRVSLESVRGHSSYSFLKSAPIEKSTLKEIAMNPELERAKNKHDKNIEVLFGNESLVITVLQALTGGAMFAALAGSEKVIEVLGHKLFLVFLTTMDFALVLAILAAYWKHEYKKWDVKAMASSFKDNQEEVAAQSALARAFLARMRNAMQGAVWIAVLGFVEIPTFAWLVALCPG